MLANTRIHPRQATETTFTLHSKPLSEGKTVSLKTLQFPKKIRQIYGFEYLTVMLFPPKDLDGFFKIYFKTSLQDSVK